VSSTGPIDNFRDPMANQEITGSATLSQALESTRMRLKLRQIVWRN
jgi:hypothetical protein